MLNSMEDNLELRGASIGQSIEYFPPALSSRTYFPGRANTIIGQCLILILIRRIPGQMVSNITEGSRRTSKDTLPLAAALPRSSIVAVSLPKLGLKPDWGGCKKSLSSKKPWSCEATMCSSSLPKNGPRTGHLKWACSYLTCWSPWKVSSGVALSLPPSVVVSPHLLPGRRFPLHQTRVRGLGFTSWLVIYH